MTLIIPIQERFWKAFLSDWPSSEFPLAQQGKIMGQWTKHMFETAPKCHFLFCFLFLLFLFFCFLLLVLQRSLWRIYTFWWLTVTFKVLSCFPCHKGCFINEYVQLQNKGQILEKDVHARVCVWTHTHTKHKHFLVFWLLLHTLQIVATCFNHSKAISWERNKICIVLSFCMPPSPICSFPWLTPFQVKTLLEDNLSQKIFCNALEEVLGTPHLYFYSILSSDVFFFPYLYVYLPYQTLIILKIKAGFCVHSQSKAQSERLYALNFVWMNKR